MVARKKVNIFKNLTWLDDSFFETDAFRAPDGWDVISGSYTTDGDIATLDGEIQKDLTDIPSDSYGKLFARFTGGTGKSLIKVKSGGDWTTIKEAGVSIGEQTYPIPAELTMTKIAISSTLGQVKIDYVGISNTDPIALEEDLIWLQVTQKDAMATSEARFEAVNKNKYLNSLMKGDRLMAWIGEDNLTKVFGGRIHEPKRKWPDKKVTVVAHGMERFVLSREYAEAVDAQFVGASLTTVISGITYDGVQAGDFTIDGVDTVINTSTGNEAVVNVNFTKTTEQQAIQSVISNLVNTGLLAEARMTPALDLKVFGAGTIDSGYTASQELGNIFDVSIIPASRLINRVILYTNGMTKYPVDGDLWTDLPTTTKSLWTGRVNHNLLVTVSATLAPDIERRTTGVASKYFKVDMIGNSGYVQLDLNFTRGVDLTEYILLKLDYYVPSGGTETTFQIRLCETLDDDGDSTSYYYRNVTIVEDVWQNLSFSTGKESAGWSTSGAISDWTAIKYVVIRFVTVDAIRDIDFWLDGLHFAKGDTYYTGEDATSILTYGRAVTSYSRNDVKTKGEANDVINKIIALHKTPSTNMVFSTKGNASLVPGENIKVTIGDEDIDQYFRMTKVVHVNKLGKYTTKLNTTITGLAFWTEPDLGMFGNFRRLTKWATLGVDIIPIWG